MKEMGYGGNTAMPTMSPMPMLRVVYFPPEIAQTLYHPTNRGLEGRARRKARWLAGRIK